MSFFGFASKRVSVFAFLVLTLGLGSRTFAAHLYPKFAGVPPPGWTKACFVILLGLQLHRDPVLIELTGGHSGG